MHKKLHFWFFVAAGAWWVTELVAANLQAGQSAAGLQNIYAELGAIDNALPSFGVLSSPTFPAGTFWLAATGGVLKYFDK